MKETIRTMAVLAGLMAGTLACGDGTTLLAEQRPPDATGAFTEKPVGFTMQLVDDSGMSASLAPQAEASADTVAVDVTWAVVHVTEVDVELPVGWDCDRYALEVSALMPVLPADAIVGECEIEDDDPELEFSGSFMLDLITGESTPSLRNLALPPGAYRRIDVEVDEVEDDEDNGGDPMAGTSLAARGSIVIDSVTRPIEIALSIGEEMRFAGGQEFAVDPTGGVDLVVAISTTAWFGGLGPQLASCINDELSLPATATTPLRFDDRQDGDNGDCTDDLADLLAGNLEQAGRVDLDLDEAEETGTEEREDAAGQTDDAEGASAEQPGTGDTSDAAEDASPQ